MIRVLIADESQRITDNLTRRLARESDFVVCGTVRDGERAVQEALRLQPDVAVLDAALPGMDGIQTTEMLAQYLPRTGVILTSMESENEAYRHAMLAGAREFLPKPFKGDELVAAIRRVYEFEQRKVALPAEGNGQAGETGGPAPGNGQVIAVFSGKGGIGKSVVASNLAVQLASKHQRRVVLVDLSLQFGDIGALLNLSTDKTIADLAAEDAVADPQLIQQVLVSGPEGVRVLMAPTSPELADYVTTQHLRALMEELQRSFDDVIVDLPSYLNEISLDVIETASQVLLVTDLSVTSVKNCRLVLSVMDVLKLPQDKFVIVANHREGASELEMSYAETFLRRQITIEIPHDAAAIPSSVSHGVPFVISAPQSPATAKIEQLALRILPAGQTPLATTEMLAAPKKKQRRLLGFARG